PQETWAKDQELPNAFENLVRAEENLRKCKGHDHFSLMKTQELKRSIIEAVSELLRSAKNGQNLEIAIWLWNLGQLDDYLIRLLDELPRERSYFEQIYELRNDTILELSSELEDILHTYETIVLSSKKRQEATLVEVFSKDALGRIRDA